jgi:phage FluMu protein Com
VNLVATDVAPRCWKCRKLLAEKVTRPWVIRCGRCKAENTEADPRDRTIVMDLDRND